MKSTALFLITSLLFFACSSSSKEETDKNDKADSDTIEVVQISEDKLEKYREIGAKYAKSTQKTLGKNLIEAISEGGTEHALSFCNVQAIPLTDSMSTIHNASLKRATDQTRNPENAANSKEMEQINHFKNLMAQGDKKNEIEPNIEVDGETVHFYYPIITNDMCLKCHGTKNKDISPETLNQIAELYPNDQATGYEANEVRGVWSIIFED